MFKFHTTGILHHAKWMSKALYCLKIINFLRVVSSIFKQTIQYQEYVLFYCEDLC